MNFKLRMSCNQHQAKIPITCAICVLLFVSSLSAQQAAEPAPPGIGNLTGVTVNGDTVTLKAGVDTVLAQIVAPNILRVSYRPAGRISPPTPVLDPKRIWPNDTPAKIDVNSDPIVISSDRIVVKISRAPLRFAIYDASSHLLLEEPKQGGVYDGGLRFA